LGRPGAGPMTPRTEKRMIVGPAGDIECAIEAPAGAARGLAVICHPHPQHGGTMDNKVATTLARAFAQAGWRAARFNFRGVGASQGAWDEGRGEIDDAVAVVDALRQSADEPLAWAGFSFGGYVASHAAAARPGSPPGPLVLVGPATDHFTLAPVPADALVIHGEYDDTVPLAATLAWARPQALPVLVVPGGGHFFHGQLGLLKSLVLRHLGA
jgi:uncharacterized protein